MPRRLLLIVAFFVPAGGMAQTPTLPDVAAMMRPYLVEAIPPVLFEKSLNWGKTSMVPHAVHWHGLRPQVIKTPRNDGHWQKVRLSTRNLPATLAFSISNPRPVGPDKQAFQVYLTFMVTVDHEYQVWESGVRLYSGSTRARARVMLLMDVENTVRLDAKKGALLPDLVIRLKATNAKVTCNDVVVEHTAGVGGTAAKMIGEAVEGIVQEVRPDLEKQLLDRVGAAIVRSADTREIRVGLGSFLK